MNQNEEFETENPVTEEAAEGEAEAPAEAAAPAEDAPEAEAEAPAEDPFALIERLAAESAELKDKLLRALAETENVRRRAQRDREDASKYAISNFAREMLLVADNLRRALDHIDADARKADETLDGVAVGVEMVERELANSLERFGVTPIEAMGRAFDHNRHEAMFEVPDPSQPAGTVVHEVERGYMLADRLLRPAKVGVSKGGPAREKSEAAAEPKTDDKKATAYEKQAEEKGGQFDEKL